MIRETTNKSILLFLFVVFFILSNSFMVKAEEVNMGSFTVTISAIAPDPPGLPPTFDSPKTRTDINLGGGGGSGGMISFSEQIQDSVFIKGMAYPNSIVSLLVSGKLETQVPADVNGRFEIHLRDINPGVYSFGIRAEDKDKRKSVLTTYSVYVTPGVTVLVDNIFIPPTITSDKVEVKRGDIIEIFGSAAPSSTIFLSLKNPTEVIKYTKSLATGDYSYKIDTSNFPFGNVTVKTKVITIEQNSPFSDLLSFKVGNINRLRSVNQGGLGDRCSKSDFNGDIKVNLFDFSIIAFWYKRVGFPAKVDLNYDNKVDLSDISILAYCWTG